MKKFKILAVFLIISFGNKALEASSKWRMTPCSPQEKARQREEARFALEQAREKSLQDTLQSVKDLTKSAVAHSKKASDSLVETKKVVKDAVANAQKQSEDSLKVVKDVVANVQKQSEGTLLELKKLSRDALNETKEVARRAAIESKQAAESVLNEAKGAFNESLAEAKNASKKAIADAKKVAEDLSLATQKKTEKTIEEMKHLVLSSTQKEEVERSEADEVDTVVQPEVLQSQVVQPKVVQLTDSIEQKMSAEKSRPLLESDNSVGEIEKSSATQEENILDQK